MAVGLNPVAPPPFTGVEPYGLLSASIVMDNITGGDLGGVVYPYRCDPATDTWPGPCEDPGPGVQKSRPGGVDMIEGWPFAVSAFETCPLSSIDEEATLEARARESLMRGEQHAVERAFWVGRGAWTGLINRSPQILSTVPVRIVDAVALAEYWLGLRDGTGMLHINPIAAAFAHRDRLANATGNVYFTPMGHRWSFGGGYPLSGPPDSGVTEQANTVWMFVTRRVTLRRSQIRVTSGFRGQSNEHDSRAERIYVPTVPCEIAAVPVFTVADVLGAPIAPPVPAMTLSVTPPTGPVPLTVTATTTNETGDVTIDWE